MGSNKERNDIVLNFEREMQLILNKKTRLDLHIFVESVAFLEALAVMMVHFFSKP